MCNVIQHKPGGPAVTGLCAHSASSTLWFWVVTRLGCLELELRALQQSEQVPWAEEAEESRKTILGKGLVPSP